VHALAQHLASSGLGANGNSTATMTNEIGEIAPYAENSGQWHQQWAGQNGHHVDQGPQTRTPSPNQLPGYDDAIQDHQQRTSSPSAVQRTSSAGYFGQPTPASSYNNVFSAAPVTPQPNGTRFVPQGWTVVPSSSSHSDGLLAPPSGPTSFSSSHGNTSLGSADSSTPTTEDDDRMSILSLGSRRSAFSRDLADPDFLANMGIIARDVPVREHSRGTLTYPDSFTGKDLVSTLQEVIPAELFCNSQEPTSDEQQRYYARLAALQVADALREQNLFHEVEWEQGEIVDSDDALYTFSDEMLVRSAPVRRPPAALLPGPQTEEPQEIRAARPEQVAGPSDSTSRAGPNKRGPQRSKTMRWQDTVSPEVRDKLGKWEVQRQNATLETIEREEQFLADLELLQNLYVNGLRAKNVIPADEYDDFVKVVFGNHRQLASHIRGLVEELHVRQAEHYPIVREIGDLFLNAALGWGEEYCSAITNYPFAANRVEKEEAKNPTFRTFLEECLRDPRAQRLSLTTFLYRPVVRLQRYHLHFKSIMDVIKKSRDATEQSGRNDAEMLREYETLTTASNIIHTQVENAQRDLATSQDKVAIANFAEAFAANTKRSDFEVDMDLLNPERQLKHQGLVFLDNVKMQAILFDNYFVLAKEPKAVGDQPPSAQRLVLARRPIPVELLETSGFNSQSTSTSLALKFMHLSSSARKVSRQVWPFTVSHSHGRTESFVLTVSKEAARREWQRKIEETCAMRKIVQDAVKAWTVSTINDDVYGVHSTSSGGNDASRDPTNKGTITCASPFHVVLEGQRRPCVAVGTDSGVYIGPRHSSAHQKVLNLKNVTQIAIMDQMELMFVLADKVLWACRLVDLFVRPQNLTGIGSSPTLKSISAREEEVAYVNLGVIDSAHIAVYAKKKQYDKTTSFTVVEAYLDLGWSMHMALPNRGGSGSLQFKLFGPGRFDVAADVYSVQFRRKGLSMCSSRGIELCNLGREESPAFLPVPHFKDTRREDAKIQALQKRIKTARPMALFKITDTEFLCCYNSFGCFVNPDRTIAREGAVIEWETEPTSFVYRNPYLLAIDPRFVEIRIFNSATVSSIENGVSALSGRLLQFFRGEHMRLLNSQANDSVDLMPAFDNQRSLAGGAVPPASYRDPDQDTIVLGALKRPRGSNRTARAFQAVVEVVPLQYGNTTPAPRRWPHA